MYTRHYFPSNIGQYYIDKYYSNEISELTETDDSSIEEGKNKFASVEYQYMQSIFPIYFYQDIDSVTENVHFNSGMDSFAFSSSRKLKENILNNDPYMQAKILVSIMHDCYFEMGIWTEADAYFSELLQKFGSFIELYDQLSWIVNHYLQCDHILEGVLHILYNYEYDEIGQVGISLGISCAYNHSPVILDLLITCFDKWDTIDAIEILKGIEIEYIWLAEYRDEVIERLSKKIRDVR